MGIAALGATLVRMVPDRKPVSGPVSQLPDEATASSFRPDSQAMDYLRRVNTLAIVLAMPAAMLTHGAPGRSASGHDQLRVPSPTA